MDVYFQNLVDLKAFFVLPDFVGVAFNKRSSCRRKSKSVPVAGIIIINNTVLFNFAFFLTT